MNNFSFRLKQAATEDLARCKYSTDEVAAAITALSGHEITAATIESVISVKSPKSFPLEILPAWVRVTGSRQIVALIEGLI